MLVIQDNLYTKIVNIYSQILIIVVIQKGHYIVSFQLHPKIKMNNQIELFKNQLENTINMDSQQFSNNINNQLTAEKLGYQNSSNETIFKGSKFFDDSLKTDLDIIWQDNGLDFEAVKRDLFFKNAKGEMIKRLSN